MNKLLNQREYQICNRCIMDTTDPDIVFDEHGYCNHCTDALELGKKVWFPNEEGERRLREYVKKIKKEGKNKKYDCIIGLSGGVDSSYLAYMAVKNGLRPLVVHIDCGWNSELAVKNVENIINKLNLDLHTHVVDWEAMKVLQLAFLKASVANQDIPQDHAIFAALYSFAVKNRIHYVLSGSNFATESILPQSWGYNASDYRHIKDINRKFGKCKLSHYPHLTFFQRYIYFQFIHRMKIVKFLNLIPYNKEEAINFLSKEFGWRYYGGKHHESRFTKFFQVYYLPTKFAYDKKRAHLSSLIVSGIITREEALKEMTSMPSDPNELQADKEYVAKKLDISVDELDNIIKLPNKTYRDYKSNEVWFRRGFKIRAYLAR